MATAHISATKEQIAKVVVMAGDPLRVKLFAENYMTNIELVNEVRGMLAYTGNIGDKRVTVMGHGMGLDSIGIYAYELYDFYNVDTIIRFGSAGSYDNDVNVLDFIIAEQAWTSSDYGRGYGVDSDTINATPRLVEVAQRKAAELITDRRIVTSKVNSSPWFYKTHDLDVPEEMVAKGIVCVEMEAYALYAIANALGKEALTILTISDHIVKHEAMSADDRRTKFEDMFVVLQNIVKEIA